MLETQPLDWDTLTKRRKVQPLKVVASALKSEKPMIMDMENGHFKSLEELSNCMHASCLLPGIAGPVMNIKVTGNDDEKPKFVIRNNLKDPDYEPLGDALIYAPMPYDIAQKDGATHTIVIRSRPDGIDVTGKGGVFERLIFKRFFMRKNKLPGAFKRMASQLHKKLYAKNVIELNEASYSNRDYKDTSQPHRLTLALRPGSDEVTRLETGAEERLGCLPADGPRSREPGRLFVRRAMGHHQGRSTAIPRHAHKFPCPEAATGTFPHSRKLFRGLLVAIS